MASLEESDEEQDYDGTIDENAYLFEVGTKYSGPRGFLSREEKIYARNVKMHAEAACVWLDYETDVDGCVVEITNICGVLLPIRHLTLCPVDSMSLKDLKSVLKKHLKLSEFSQAALSNLNHCVGIQLFYENGWEGWLGLIPECGKKTVAMQREVIRRQAFQVFQGLRAKLGLKLSEYAAAGVALQTVAKNDLGDLRTMFILPGDRREVMQAFDSVLSNLKVNGFQAILFCFRFGEKMKEGISLGDFRIESIKKVTVHAAVDISSSIPGVNLLWSMQGISQLIGDRGTLSTCLSLSDCGNFQSNLDGRRLDVKAELLRLFVNPDLVTFVQLYADVAHLKPKSRFHPVSGVIAGGLCFPYQTTEAFKRDAERYVSVLKQNFGLLKRSSCRLEMVGEVKPMLHIKASDCIDLNKVHLLLQSKPLLVPLPDQSLWCILEVGLWLSRKLEKLLREYAKTGNVNATWQAYQFELDCEKILWGRPLCYQSVPYSVNLGPGAIGRSRSLTDHLGFIALEPHTACMHNEDSLPPWKIWTRSEALGKSIVRACGIHDHLDASNPVLGRLLLLSLLKDFHELGKVSGLFRFADFLSALKSTEPGVQIVGAVTVDSLVKLLMQPRRCQVFMVFGSLCKLIVQHKLSLEELLHAGIQDLALKQFPAFETSDQHRNSILRWNVRNSFWRVESISNSAIHATCGSPDIYSRLACCELDQRGLIFPSKLKKLPAVWPWIEPCLKKLVQERLTEDKLVLTLSFLSAVAFCMSGMFVDYDRFYTLFLDCPVKQFRLKVLEIQSKLSLGNVHFPEGRMVFRLHPSIPHKIEVAENKERLTEAPPVQEEVLDIESVLNNQIVEEDDICLRVNCTEIRPSNCEPVGCPRGTWSSPELELLDELCSDRTGKNNSRKHTLKDLYSLFRDRYLKQGIPVRTFFAFRRKMQKVWPNGK